MVAAGGISNLIDRMIYEEGVIDFVSIGIGNFRTGIINLTEKYITSCQRVKTKAWPRCVGRLSQQKHLYMIPINDIIYHENKT